MDDVVVVPTSDIGAAFPPIASCGGHGTFEIREVVRILEANSIPCCLVGTSGLIYYGADRGRGDCEICVPTEKLDTASAILRDEKHCTEVFTMLVPQPGSLLHTFPRFQCNALNLFFVLVPAEDCHIECSIQNIERSQNDLPYPKLNHFIQSLVDINDRVALFDVIDGADVQESWGDKNLDLTDTDDILWAKRKNEIINSFGQDTLGVDVSLSKRKDIWTTAVNGKVDRLGWTTPSSQFITRFRLFGSPDPWTVYRKCA